jgi:hypothetical protein
MTTLLHRTIQNPTAIELSVWCRFTHEGEINLCVTKANVLEIYSTVDTVVEDEDEDEDEDVDEDEDEENDETAEKEPETTTSLRIVARYTLFGRIETLNKISFNSLVARSCGEAGAMDVLMMTFSQEQKCVIVAFDQATQTQLRVLSMFDFSPPKHEDLFNLYSGSSSTSRNDKDGDEDKDSSNNAASTSSSSSLASSSADTKVGTAVHHDSSEYDTRVERSGKCFCIFLSKRIGVRNYEEAYQICYFYFL